MKTTSRRRQIVRIGMDTETATELHFKHGVKGSPFEDQKVLFNFLYVLKHSPMYENVQWKTHEERSPATIWRKFWSALDYFLDCADELDWAGRLNKYNHSLLYPYLVTVIGDCFLVEATSGRLNDVLFVPKYADEVYKLLLLVDQLGQYRCVGGLACGARSDTRVLKGCGPQPSHFKKGEVMLLDGGFPRRLHEVIPYPKPKEKQFARWCAKYNDGHQFLPGHGEHPFTQLYTWAVCHNVSTKLGLNWEERVQCLHLMGHAVIHVQQFMNKRSVRYQLHGFWGHFPRNIFRTKACTLDSDSSTCSSTSSLSLSSLTPKNTSCSSDAIE